MVRKALSEDVRGERGQILLLTALSMTTLLAMAALSIDASFMYDKRNRLYAAADAGAKSAALEVRRGNTTPANLQAFADHGVGKPTLPAGDTNSVLDEAAAALKRLLGGTSHIVYGTDIYSIDSPLAGAALHAGVLQPGQTGMVRVTFVGPQQAFQSSMRHGILSSAYGQGPGFRVDSFTTPTGIPATIVTPTPMVNPVPVVPVQP